MAAMNTPPGIISFPALFTPKPDDAGKNWYSTTLIFPPEAQKSPEYKALQNAVADAAKAKFGANVNFKTLKLPFGDGSEKADRWAGYTEDSTYINLKSQTKPEVVDTHLQTIHTAQDVYPGCLARANVGAFAWEWKGKKGVSLGLNHVQVLSKDQTKYPRVDGRQDASKVFDVFDDGSSTGDDEVPF